MIALENPTDVARAAYGALQTLMLVSALPHARRYLASERWGGYTESGRWTDRVLSPSGVAALLVLWMAAALCLMTGRLVVAAAAVNLVLCHYFFIRLRWRSVLRGMGAPGFISFWLGAAIFLIELTTRHAPALRPLALLTVRVDFALIMISAGLYKVFAGYRAGAGMELGLVNPEWGHWHRFWRRWPPAHGLFRLMNESAWATEVCAGVLILIPATRPLGALLLALSFVFIATQIRLGFLCEMVIVCCVLLLDGSGALAAPAGWVMPMFAARGVAALLVMYLALIPVVRVALFYNQLAHKALGPWLQRAIDAYANAFGIILWRVFTADIVGFFVRVWEAPSGGPRRELTAYDGGVAGVGRFRQVAESIALTSVFTTLKYYPSDRRLFEARLLRYARTVPVAPESRVVFEWVAILPRADRFEFVPIAEYRVDAGVGAVETILLSDEASVSSPHAASPVHEGARPGSYAPLPH